MDPRFKSKVDKDEVWDRIREASIAANTIQYEFDLFVTFYSSTWSKETHRVSCSKMKMRMKKTM